jgi:hypothetical protein
MAAAGRKRTFPRRPVLKFTDYLRQTDHQTMQSEHQLIRQSWPGPERIVRGRIRSRVCPLYRLAKLDFPHDTPERHT